MAETIAIHTPYIKLDNLLKYGGICVTGGEAKLLIESEQVLVNGQVCPMRGKKLYPGDQVTVKGKTLLVTSP